MATNRSVQPVTVEMGEITRLREVYSALYAWDESPTEETAKALAEVKQAADNFFNDKQSHRGGAEARHCRRCGVKLSPTRWFHCSDCETALLGGYV